MQVHMIEEDGELPMSIANGAGIATNRNAVGPLAVSLPDEAVLGDRFEVHAVEAEDLTVAMPATHGFRHGATLAQAVTLHGGGALVCVRTKPAVWTGTVSGSFSFS